MTGRLTVLFRRTGVLNKRVDVVSRDKAMCLENRDKCVQFPIDVTKDQRSKSSHP